MFYNLVTLKNPLRYFFFLAIIFLGLALSYRGHGALSDPSKTLLTVTSFVFGFYVNNLLTHARNRHGKVLESLREEGGYIKAIYLNLKACFSQDVRRAGQQEIDNYMMAGMDYKVYDYAKSAPEFEKLYIHLMTLQPDSKQQDGAYGQIIRIISEVSKNRNRIETMVKERVSFFEWLTISTLLGLVLYFVFSLNNGSYLSIILTTLIATTLTMLLVVLYSLDSLRWKEDKWFWTPLEELFIGLDLVPYYPKILVDRGRVKPPAGLPVRLATYPHAYPDLQDKKVHLYEKWHRRLKTK